MTALTWKQTKAKLRCVCTSADRAACRFQTDSRTGHCACECHKYTRAEPTEPDRRMGRAQ